MSNPTALDNLLSYTKVSTAYQSALTALSWEAATGAPNGKAAEIRGETMGILSGLMYSHDTDLEMGRLLDMVEKEPMDERASAIVRVLRKEYDRQRKLPKEFVVEYATQAAKAERVWETCKTSDDYETFAPYLDKMIQLTKQMAEYTNRGGSLYDTLLDDFEEGLDIAQADEYFATMKAKIVPLLQKIMASKKKIDTSFLELPVSIDQQRKISSLMMDVVGYDRTRGWLAESEHPFSTSMNKYDCRITTKYHETNHASSVFSILHESGHALYEMGKADNLVGTPLDGGVSMGIHESQSRFYENIVGRSEAFVQTHFDALKKLLGAPYAHVTPKMYFEAINNVTPSYIRIEADELTYSLHIMIRYEMEKMFINGDYDIKKLPKQWFEMVEAYLGLPAVDNKNGILQDTHWSGGLFGYFPSYSIGSAYSAQFLHAMQKDLSVEDCIRQNNIGAITNWLGDHVHRFGKMKSPKDVLQFATGEAFNPQYYADYLTQKYTALYEL